MWIDYWMNLIRLKVEIWCVELTFIEISGNYLENFVVVIGFLCDLIEFGFFYWIIG
jgi:hypothetical protein